MPYISWLIDVTKHQTIYFAFSRVDPVSVTYAVGPLHSTPLSGSAVVALTLPGTPSVGLASETVDSSADSSWYVFDNLDSFEVFEQGAAGRRFVRKERFLLTLCDDPGTQVLWYGPGIDGFGAGHEQRDDGVIVWLKNLDSNHVVPLQIEVQSASDDRIVLSGVEIGYGAAISIVLFFSRYP
jgi:hypothetical protein